MATELQDPFADVSLPSLFPLTLASHSLPFAPDGAIDSLLKSMALKESEEDIAQAKVMSINGQSIANSSKDGGEIAAASGHDRKQVRRPALGRKKAVFSLKSSIPRNSIVSVDTSSQMERVEDPVEYFLLCEQLDQADKELKKLNGDVAADPFLLSPTTRKRRPGLSRRTSSYRHQFSASETAEALQASQEADTETSGTTKASKLLKPNETSYQEQPDAESITLEPRAASCDVNKVSKTEVAESEKEKNINNILDQLLSSFKHLNEAQSTTLLRESLQIKKIDVGKINLPPFHTFGIDGVDALKSMAAKYESNGHQISLTSSATTRSPVGAISRPVDPVENISVLCPNIDANFTNSDMEYLVSRSAHTTSGDVFKSTSFSLVDKLRRRASEADKTLDDSSDSEEEGIGKKWGDMVSEHPDHVVEDPIPGHTDFTAKDCNNVVEGDHVSGTSIHCNSEGFDFTMQDEGAVVLQDEVVACIGKEELFSKDMRSVTDVCTLSGNEVHANFEPVDVTMQQKGTVAMQDEPEAHTKPSHDDSIVSAKDLVLDGLLTAECDATLRSNETRERQEVTAVAQRKSKRQRTESREKKLHSRRKSLAAAGMTWDSGVRKSTRIRSRPLNFWLGERYLYGRIHDSLATVVGKVITTPGKDGKGPKLKIESFVPEDLVSQVAQK